MSGFNAPLMCQYFARDTRARRIRSDRRHPIKPAGPAADRRTPNAARLHCRHAPTHSPAGGCRVSIELQPTDGTTTVASTRFALGQIASHYKIPTTYVDRMTQAGAGPLLAQNLAYWFTKQPSTRLLRTRTGDTGGLRAFLLRRYRPLDNYELAEAVIPQLERPGVHVVLTRITLQATSDRVIAEVRRCGFRPWLTY